MKAQIDILTNTVGGTADLEQVGRMPFRNIPVQVSNLLEVLETYRPLVPPLLGHPHVLYESEHLKGSEE